MNWSAGLTALSVSSQDWQGTLIQAYKHTHTHTSLVVLKGLVCPLFIIEHLCDWPLPSPSEFHQRWKRTHLTRFSLWWAHSLSAWLQRGNIQLLFSLLDDCHYTNFHSVSVSVSTVCACMRARICMCFSIRTASSSECVCVFQIQFNTKPNENVFVFSFWPLGSIIWLKLLFHQLSESTNCTL